MDHIFFNNKFYCNKKVLVTGGAGFIGSHLSDSLIQNGASVRVIDNLSDGLLSNLDKISNSIEFIQGDITNISVVQSVVNDIDIVFHLAANASVPRSVKYPHYDFYCNALGTLNILNSIRKSKNQSCIVASSGAVYGQPTKFPILEDEVLRPISPYGASKMAVEGLCFAFNYSYCLPIKIARIFNSYGPRQPRFVMFDFYRKLHQDPNHLEILGDGNQIRDYSYVDDIVDALLRMGQLEECTCDVFNISSGKSYSIIEVAKAITDILELKDVHYTFTGSSWAGDAQRWYVSNDKLRTITGFEPKYDLYEGLKKFIDWFNTHPERIK